MNTDTTALEVIKNITSQLLKEDRAKAKVYFTLTQDLITQCKECLALEIPLHIPTVLKTIEDSLNEFRAAAHPVDLPELQK